MQEQMTNNNTEEQISEEELLKRLVEQMKEGASEDDILGLVDKVSDDAVEEVLEGTENQPETQETQSQETESTPEPQTEEPVAEESAKQEEPEPETESEEKQMTLLEEITQEIQKDPVLRQLAQMSEEDRIAWAQQVGTEGIIKLMQLQKLETAMMIERAKVEAQLPSLDAIAESFYERNKELLQNPVLQEIAKGLELNYLAEMGVSGYWELNPVQLQRLLAKVEARLKEVAKGMGMEGVNKDRQDMERKDVKADNNSMNGFRTNPSVGDVGAGKGTQVGLEDILNRVANDPLSLEEALDKLPKSKIDDLLAELED